MPERLECKIGLPDTDKDMNQIAFLYTAVKVWIDITALKNSLGISSEPEFRRT